MKKRERKNNNKFKNIYLIISKIKISKIKHHSTNRINVYNNERAFATVGSMFHHMEWLEPKVLMSDHMMEH